MLVLFTDYVLLCCICPNFGTKSHPPPPVSLPWPKQLCCLSLKAADERRSDTIEMVRRDPLLMTQMREMLAKQDGGAAAAAVDAEIVRSVAASLGAMKRGSKSNTGRIAYNTVLAAVAGAGEHTCDPAHPCSPAARCPPGQPRDAAASLTARAERLGVRPNTYRQAHVRMHNANLSIPPKEALDEGRYLWTKPKTRSDATDERVVDLATRYWHSDDISRASGDSGKTLL